MRGFSATELPEGQPEWRYALDVSCLDFSWGAEAGEWFANIEEIFGERNIAAGSAANIEDTHKSYPRLRYYPVYSEINSYLDIRPSGNGPPHIDVCGYGKERANDVEFWQDLIQEARTRMRFGDPFTWSALIGSDPGRRASEDTKLKSVSTVGDLRLIPPAECLLEAVKHTDSFNSRSQSLSWPIVVEGCSTGRGWARTMSAVREEIYRLCLLLSVGWGGCWRLRNGPLHLSPGEYVAPSSYPWDTGIDREADLDYDPEPRHLVEAEEWFSGGLERLRSDDKMRRCCEIYHEGLLLQFQHPSLAFIAFVAAVESLGELRYESLPRCEQCGAVTESGKRFRKLLRMVLTRKEADVLWDAYERRSRTVHSGALHGLEPSFGDLRMDDFHLPGPRSSFSGYYALRLQEAACKLLRLELSSGDVGQTSLIRT